MKILALIPLWVFLGACASSSDSGERSKGVRVSAGTGSNTVNCPSRNSTCYADVQRMCGERGVEHVSGPTEGQVSMAGRSNSGDDPFARADRQRTYDQPVRLRCKTGSSTSN